MNKLNKNYWLIKIICLVAGIIIIGDMYSMEQKPTAKKLAHVMRGKELFNYTETAELYTHEFPLMSPDLASYRYARCDDKVKKEIQEKFAAQRDECFKDEKLKESLKDMFSGFTVAIKMPRELHLMVAQRIFDGNETAARIFLQTPIRKMHKVFKLREWVKNVQQGKAVWPFVSSIWRYDKDTDERLQMKADLLDTSFLLQYHNEIKKLSDWFPKYFHPTYGWRAINIDYNDIKTLCLLNEAINKGKENTEKPWWIGMEHDYYYRSYDTYTLTNFWHRLKENKIVLTYYAICMVPIVAASISRFIELNYCKKILTESDVSANKDAIVFNEWLKAKVQKIDPDILPYTRIEGHKSIIEPYYSWSDFFKKDSPLFLVLPSVSILTERVEQIPFYQNNFFGFLVANVTVMPIVSYCALKPIAWLLSELPLSEFFYLSSYVTAFFCGCALGITLLNMRLWRRQEVSLSDLPAILKKCDDGLIVIEEKQ